MCSTFWIPRCLCVVATYLIHHFPSFYWNFPASLENRNRCKDWKWGNPTGPDLLHNCKMILALLIPCAARLLFLSCKFQSAAWCLGEEPETALGCVLCSVDNGLWNLTMFPVLQRKQEQKAPDKDAILKATANLPSRNVDRTVAHHNMRDVSIRLGFNLHANSWIGFYLV